jgi:hypothetical protein
MPPRPSAFSGKDCFLRGMAIAHLVTATRPIVCRLEQYAIFLEPPMIRMLPLVVRVAGVCLGLTMPAAAAVRFESTDAAVVLTGAWFTNTNAAHSGGQAVLSMDAGARASFRFNGTGVRWIGYRDEWAGVARVGIDGVQQAVIDTYGSPGTSQAVLFASVGLPAGDHTLTIDVTGDRGPSSSGSWVWVDAFEVDTVATPTGTPSSTPTATATARPTPTVTATPTATSTVRPTVTATATATTPPTTGRVEQDDPAVVRTGVWYSNSSASAGHSGGTAMLSMDVGASAALSFTGTGVRWIGVRDEWSGRANVYVDGQLAAVVDTYASPGQSAAVLYSATGLTAGAHAIRIEVAGTRNASSGGTWVWVDAFDVLSSATPTATSTATPTATATATTMPTTTPTATATATPTGTAPPATVRIEQDDPSVVRTGAWYVNNSASAGHSAGTAMLSMDVGASATLSFTGTGIRWIGVRDEWSGRANVYLDGQLAGVVDTYASPGQSATVLYAATGLSSGAHALRVEVAGTRNASSGGTWVWVDAFDVQSNGTPTPTPRTTPTSSPTATPTDTPPSWTLTVSPGARTTLAADAAAFDVAVSGAAGATSLTVSGAPASAVVRLDPATLSGPGVAHLTVETASWTTAGTYDVVVRADAAGGSREAHAVLTITHELPLDAQTLLVLRFDGTARGAGGEAPLSEPGVTYGSGLVGGAATFTGSARIVHSGAGNCDPSAGTLEAWIRGNWNGSDGGNGGIADYGAAGGARFLRSGPNLRAIFNLFGSGGQPETSVNVDVSAWRAREWHHVAFTWNRSTHLAETYVDGLLRGRAAPEKVWPTVTNADLTVGNFSTGEFPFNGDIDELRVSASPRSAAEIAVDAAAGAMSHAATSVSIQPNGTVSLYPTWTWWETPVLHITTDAGPFDLTGRAARWTSDAPGIALPPPDGRVRGVGPGSTTVRATIGSASATLPVTVAAPARPASDDPIPSFLATPASGALWEVPVAIIRYVPTRDGANLDSGLTGASGTVDSWRSVVDRKSIQVKFGLEEGSRFHGYRVTTEMVTPPSGTNACGQAVSGSPVNHVEPDASVPPSLAYRVVKLITVYEEIPPGVRIGNGPTYLPDYTGILERFGGRDWIENQGVKQVWIWLWDYGRTSLREFTISSPYVPYIEGWTMNNEWVPIYGKSFGLLTYNINRGAELGLHNHGHFIEGLLAYAALRQDGNQDLFWNAFAGRTGPDTWVTGRAGWTHMPPNTTCHYDYGSPATVDSDIMDWRPGGGSRRPVNVATWKGIPYAWPDGLPPEAEIPGAREWHIFWMQNIPGRGNAVPYYGSGYLTNWWSFVGDQDGSWRNGLGLHAATPTP